MQGEQLMDLDGYEKGYAHGWRDGRAETPDPGGLREAATEHHGPRCAFCGGDWKDDHFDEWAAKGHIRCRCNDNRCRIGAALASPVPTDRPEPCWFCEREVGYLIAGYDTWDEQRLACLDCDRTIKALYAKGWLPTDRPEPIDEERLWRAIAGIGVIDNGTWVSFRREDATTIAAAYRTEPGETMTHTDYTLVDD